jgi:putative transposase
VPRAGAASLDTKKGAEKGRADDAALTADIVALATEYGRYGYRRITALLRAAGWAVNVKRVERIWRLEGLKVPSKQPRKGRLWLNERSCVRLRPERPNHVWSYDFVEDRTHNGRKFRMRETSSTSSPASAWRSGSTGD